MPRAQELTPERSARHLFGHKVRELRRQEELSLEALAAVLVMSKSHLGRVETADHMPPPEMAGKLDLVYETGGIFGQLYALCRREVHPDRYQHRMDLEARAVVIQEYTPQIVPGLLQTEGYARAQFQVHNPKAAPAKVQELVAARLGRQALLLADPRPDYSVILDEGVLRRSYGGPAVMREQLGKLVELALTPTTFVQVLPFSHGGHALEGGSVSLWTMREGNRVAYEEAVSTGTLLEDPSEVQERVRAYDLLSASALSPNASASLIQSVMEAIPDE